MGLLNVIKQSSKDALEVELGNIFGHIFTNVYLEMNNFHAFFIYFYIIQFNENFCSFQKKMVWVSFEFVCEILTIFQLALWRWALHPAPGHRESYW